MNWNNILVALAVLSVLAPVPAAAGSSSVRRAGGASARGKTAEEWSAGQSIYWPKYIAEGTVYTRSVKDMPVLPNSKEIAAYMKRMPSEYNKVGVITSANLTSFNLPVYTVDSHDPKMNFAKVDVPEFRNHMVKPELRKVMFTDPVPIPVWCRRAEGGDHSMAIYDVATGILREYFCVEKKDDSHWIASYGGFVKTNLRDDLPKKNWAMQMEYGTCFAPGILGAPGQIGIEEARRGKINHAVIFTMANPRKGVVSWPAFQTDGTNENPLAPAEGQWFRIPPGVNLKKLNLQPLTLLVARACQEYGGFASDKNLFCHAFNFEPSYQEESLRRKAPLWEPGGELWKKYKLKNNLMNDFPWELTEWAPPGWGKDEDHKPKAEAPAAKVVRSAIPGLARWEESYGPRKVELSVVSVELGDALAPCVLMTPAPAEEAGGPATVRNAVKSAKSRGCVAAISAPADIRDYLPFGKKAMLIKEGEPVAGLDDKMRAARAFVGKSEDGSRLVFVVAKGAYGSGLTAAECAQYLVAQVCDAGFELPDASHAVLLFDEGRGLSPLVSTASARPCPALFGIRAKSKKEED